MTEDELARLIRRVVREENESLLAQHVTLKPLQSLKGVAKSLDVSIRTAETMLASGEFPPALWIAGQRRWHPDTVAAFLRSRDRLRRPKGIGNRGRNNKQENKEV